MSKTRSNLLTESGGPEKTRFNALRHGVLSDYTVLPWEDPGEYHALLSALVVEHAPRGPTEEHLVEELAGILWRKRRLRLAETAAHRRGLEDALEPFRNTVKAALVLCDPTDHTEDIAEAVRATVTDTEEAAEGLWENEAITRRALNLLGERCDDAYEAALATMAGDTQDWWAETLAEPEELDEGEKAATPDAASLRHFLEVEVLPWFEKRKKELANRPLIREQAFGEALDPGRLERFGRYEVHLDRKLERMLTILLRLKELRRGNEME
jgi:hypothetical protein